MFRNSWAKPWRNVLRRLFRSEIRRRHPDQGCGHFDERPPVPRIAELLCLSGKGWEKMGKMFGILGVFVRVYDSMEFLGSLSDKQTSRQGVFASVDSVRFGQGNHMKPWRSSNRRLS